VKSRGWGLTRMVFLGIVIIPPLFNTIDRIGFVVYSEAGGRGDGARAKWLPFPLSPMAARSKQGMG
jgi:hypothetical protein